MQPVFSALSAVVQLGLVTHAGAIQPKAPPASLELVLLNQLSSNYEVESMMFRLDDAPLFSPGQVTPTRGAPHALTTVEVAPGAHQLSYEVTVRGSSSFPYVSGYRLVHRGHATLDARPGQRLRVTTTSSEPGSGVLTPWERRPVVVVDGSAEGLPAAPVKSDAELLAELNREAAAKLAGEASAVAQAAPAPAPTCNTAPLRFAFKRTRLDARSRAELDALGRCIAAVPGARLRLVGHTDQRGDPRFNEALGLRRAAAVAKYLSFLGVEIARLTVGSAGLGKPVCSDQSERCYASNRRVEIDFDVPSTSVTASR